MAVKIKIHESILEQYYKYDEIIVSWISDNH